MNMPGHARGRHIEQDDAAFYRITSIPCFLLWLLKYLSSLSFSNRLVHVFVLKRTHCRHVQYRLSYAVCISTNNVYYIRLPDVFPKLQVTFFEHGQIQGEIPPPYPCYNVFVFLLNFKAILARYMPWPSVCLCLSVYVCLCVSVSVTSPSSTKTAKRRMTQTTPHYSPGILFF